jgi:hypothetical protein
MGDPQRYIEQCVRGELSRLGVLEHSPRLRAQPRIQRRDAVDVCERCREGRQHLRTYLGARILCRLVRRYQLVELASTCAVGGSAWRNPQK